MTQKSSEFINYRYLPFRNNEKYDHFINKYKKIGVSNHTLIGMAIKYVMQIEETIKGQMFLDDYIEAYIYSKPKRPKYVRLKPKEFYDHVKIWHIERVQKEKCLVFYTRIDSDELQARLIKHTIIPDSILQEFATGVSLLAI